MLLGTSQDHTQASLAKSQKNGCRKIDCRPVQPLCYHNNSNTGSVTLTGVIVQEETSLGLEIVNCQDVMSAAGDSSGDTSLELLAPGDEVRQKPRQSSSCVRSDCPCV